MRIILNRNQELVKEINLQMKKIKEKEGKNYCPCSLIHDEDSICMCKDFIESNELGECHCGKYIKVEI